MKRELLDAFVDAAVENPDKARAMLREAPDMLHARLLHGETPLHFLAVEGFVAGVHFLAEAGADVDATNAFSDTALVDVATLGNVEVAAVLLQHGADPNAPSPTRDCALHAATGSGSAELVDALLSAGARADYVTDLGETIWDVVDRVPAQAARLTAVLAKHGASRRTRGIWTPPSRR